MKVVDVEEVEREENPEYEKLELLKQDSLGNMVFQLVRFKPGITSKLHFHKQTKEIYYSLGEAAIGINGRKIEAVPGTTILIEPLDKHQIINESGKPFELLVLKFDLAENDFFEVKE